MSPPAKGSAAATSLVTPESAEQHRLHMRRVHDAAELDRAIRSARACAAELLAALDLGRASQPALEALSSKALAAVGHLRDAAARLSE